MREALHIHPHLASISIFLLFSLKHPQPVTAKVKLQKPFQLSEMIVCSLIQFSMNNLFKSFLSKGQAA
jgi:hypothetical protein